MYFTAAGEVAGVGVDVFASHLDDDPPEKLRVAGYWKPSVSFETGKPFAHQYHLSVSFREPSIMCNPTPTGVPLGDRLVINQDTIAKEVPATEAQAVADGFVRGSCFKTMGVHYFKDLSSANMSWYAENLMPITPMYFQGKINAFLFASWYPQEGISTNWWEPMALPDFAMCKNFCDSRCTFHYTHRWSTMHIYLQDHHAATCDNGCELACCPH